MARKPIQVFNREVRLGLSRQRTGATGTQQYGLRERTGLRRLQAGVAAPGETNALAAAYGPSAPSFGKQEPPAELARAEPEAMTPGARQAATLGGLGGYPGAVVASQVPGAYEAYEMGAPLSGIAMRTAASPFALGLSTMGAVNALADYARQVENAERLTTMKEIDAPGLYGKLGMKMTVPSQPVVSPQKPIGYNRLTAALRQSFGLNPSLAEALSADPMSDYGGFGGLAPNVDLSSTAYGQSMEQEFGTPQAWGGDIDIGGEAGGGGDGGGYGGGLGGGFGGEGDVGSGETGAGLGPGHGGDADTEGQW